MNSSGARRTRAAAGHLRAVGSQAASLPRLSEHPDEMEHLLRALDLALSAAAFAGVASALGVGVGFGLLGLGLASSLVWPLCLRRRNAYSLSRLGLDVQMLTRELVTAALSSAAGVAALAFTFQIQVPPSLPLLAAGAQLGVLAVVRLAILLVLHWLGRSGRVARHVLIVGTGPRAAYVKEVIDRSASWGLHVIGFVDDARPPDGPAVPEERIWKLSDMPTLLRDEVVDEVIVACPRSLLGSIVSVVDAAAAAGVPITLLSDLFGDYLPPPKVRRFGSLPALRFAPVHHNAVKLLVKRGVDVAGALALGVLSLPVVAIAALGIKLTSHGPALFRQTRCTKYGRPFVMLKLRTMYADAEARLAELEDRNEMDGPVFKMRGDPRITPIGRFLRRFSVDELPQLWNVLWGDMSLVGPRPPLPSEVLAYQTFERRRLSMRPGITCLWQVNGRNEIGFEDWVRLDLEYIDTWSLVSDVRILVRTLSAALRGSGV